MGCVGTGMSVGDAPRSSVSRSLTLRPVSRRLRVEVDGLLRRGTSSRGRLTREPLGSKSRNDDRSWNEASREVRNYNSGQGRRCARGVAGPAGRLRHETATPDRSGRAYSVPLSTAHELSLSRSSLLRAAAPARWRRKSAAPSGRRSGTTRSRGGGSARRCPCRAARGGRRGRRRQKPHRGSGRRRRSPRCRQERPPTRPRSRPPARGRRPGRMDPPGGRSGSRRRRGFRRPHRGVGRRSPRRPSARGGHRAAGRWRTSRELTADRRPGVGALR